MIISLTTFILVLLTLFFLSRSITQSFFHIIYRTFKHSKLSVYLLAFIFLPGTIVHELSHFFMALLLRVRAHDIRIFPHIEANGEVKAGQVIIDKTDPIRHTIIGVAPMIVGILLLYAIGEYFFPQLSRTIPASPAVALAEEGTSLFSLISLLGLYLIFEITTTLFSSKRDLESAIIVVPILIILIVGLYFAGIRISLERNLIESLNGFIGKVNTMLIVGLATQGIMWLILATLKHFFFKPRQGKSFAN